MQAMSRRCSKPCRFSGMGKGVAQLAQGRESPLHRGVDQAHTASEDDLGTKRTQRPIRQEEAITAAGYRGHQGLQQVLLEHLQSDATGSVGG